MCLGLERAILRFRVLDAVGVVVGVTLAGCAAIYPELHTPLREAEDASALDPPPPRQLVAIDIEGATIRRSMPNGRLWDGDANDPPDPFARLVVDGRTLIETPVEPDTYRPTWPGQRPVNLLVGPGTRAIVELWDKDSVHSQPICIQRIADLRSEGQFGTVEAACDGASVFIRLGPVPARIGLGLSYQLRHKSVFVAKVLRYSPAARAGLVVGAQITELQGRPVEEMDDLEVRSAINAGARNGLRLTLQDDGGALRTVTLREGPIYLTAEETEALARSGL